MQPIWTDYIAVAALAVALFVLFVLVALGVMRLFTWLADRVDGDYDSATDWPAPPAEHRRERGGWQHMSAEERRAKFEEWCG